MPIGLDPYNPDSCHPWNTHVFAEVLADKCLSLEACLFPQARSHDYLRTVPPPSTKEYLLMSLLVAQLCGYQCSGYW